MDVVCERCQTEYEFDDALVSERGTTVKCTNCGHQFKIFRPVGDARAESRPFILRQADGTSVTFESLGVLQKWIVEGRANRQDQLSRDGATWKSLGSITELDTFFASAESARSLGRAPTLTSPAVTEPMATQNARATTGPSAQTSPRAPNAPAPPQGEPPPRGVQTRSVTISGAGPGTSNPAPPAPPVPSPVASGTRRGMVNAPVAPPAADTIETGRPGGFSMGTEDIRNSPDKFDFGETTGILERWGEGRGGAAPARVAPANATTSSSPSSSGSHRWDSNAGGSSSSRGGTERAPADESFAPIVRPARSPVTGALMGIGIGLGVVAIAGVVGWKLGAFGGPAESTVAAAPALDRVDLAVARAEDQARSATRAGFEEARDELAALLGNEPDEPRVHAARAAVLALWGESVRQRAEDFEARAAAGAADPSTLRAQAAVLRQEAGASLERARQDVAKATEGSARITAGISRARYERALGEASRVLGDDGAARAHLEAARASGGGPEVELLAALLERDGDHGDAAVQHLRALHAQMPTQARARLALGRLLATRGDAEGARAELEGLLRSEPTHEDAQSLLQAISAGQPPYRPAVAVAAVGRDAGSAGPGVVAAAVVDSGTPAAAGSSSGGSGSAPTRDYDALIAEAQRAQENGQRDRARTAFTAALSVRPGSSDALLGLGFLELDAGNTSGAISRFRQILSGNPRFSDAHWGLADAYRRQGNLEGALRAYRDYLAINPGGSRGRSARDHIDELERRLHPAGETTGNETPPAGSGSSTTPPAPAPSGESPHPSGDSPGSGSGSAPGGEHESGSGAEHPASGGDHGSGNADQPSGGGGDHGSASPARPAPSTDQPSGGTEHPASGGGDHGSGGGSDHGSGGSPSETPSGT